MSAAYVFNCMRSSKGLWNTDKDTSDLRYYLTYLSDRREYYTIYGTLLDKMRRAEVLGHVWKFKHVKDMNIEQAIQLSDLIINTIQQHCPEAIYHPKKGRCITQYIELNQS